MHIPITQPTEDIAGDLVFTQPKFHFGQVLEDPKGDRGFVIGMSYGEYWHYTLFYTEMEAMSGEIPEFQLASSSTTVDAQTSQPLLEGSKRSHLAGRRSLTEQRLADRYSVPQQLGFGDACYKGLA